MIDDSSALEELNGCCNDRYPPTINYARPYHNYETSHDE